jgi:hypothetical protein
VCGVVADERGDPARIDRTLLWVITDTTERIHWAQQRTDKAETIRRAQSAQRAAIKIALARGMPPALIASALDGPDRDD